MIGKLSGRIDTIDGKQIIIDVQGVGYVVTTSARTLRQIGPVGSAASLLIETQVREDAISLFGFADQQERDWFRLLTTVQGVGARVGLAILGVLGPDQLAQAISSQDKAAICQADGVGPKLGLRIVTELKDKVIGFFAPSPSAAMATAPQPLSSTTSEALSALMNLGYKRIEAFAAVTAATQRLGLTASLNDLIKNSLSELSRKES